MKDKLKKVGKVILPAMGITAVLSLAGTVGAVECDNMNLLEGVRQLMMAFVFLVFAVVGYYVLEGGGEDDRKNTSRGRIPSEVRSNEKESGKRHGRKKLLRQDAASDWIRNRSGSAGVPVGTVGADI